MFGSEFVFQTRTEGDAFITRATMFMGPRREEVDIAAALLKAGHHLTAVDIPGLWRIDGGPELTTRQLMQVAREMLDRPCQQLSPLWR